MADRLQRGWRYLAAIAWPAFIMAAVLELLVFALVDPLQLHTLSGSELALSAQAVYTLSFFVFWIAGIGTGLMTLSLARSSRRINREGPVGPVGGP
ncbi:MAG: hypothetical protein ABIN96_14165 [Rubrivivax sp.]